MSLLLPLFLSLANYRTVLSIHNYPLSLVAILSIAFTPLLLHTRPVDTNGNGQSNDHRLHPSNSDDSEGIVDNG